MTVYVYQLCDQRQHVLFVQDLPPDDAFSLAARCPEDLLGIIQFAGADRVMFSHPDMPLRAVPRTRITPKLLSRLFNPTGGCQIK